MPSSDQTQPRIVSFQPAHVHGVARTHSECFPGFFLTTLGQDFLILYYRHYLTSTYGFGTVALGNDGDVVGFALGVTNLDAHDSSFLRQNLLTIVSIVLRRCLHDAAARRNVWERGRRLSRVVLKSGRRRQPSGGQNDSTRDPYATLTSLAVLPTQRGRGLAADLVDAFGEIVKSKSFSSMRVATALDNHRARAFYEKSGWAVQQVRKTENGVTYERFV